MSQPVLSHENHTRNILGIASTFLALTTIAIALRCYCRIFKAKCFGWDDWLAFTAWFFFILSCVFTILGCLHGTGRHVWDIPLHEIPIALKWWWACELVYILANMGLKASIGIFLLRIVISRTQRILIWTAIVVIEVISVACFLIFILQCYPSAYFWTRFSGGKGKCNNPRITVNASYVYSSFTCVVDWTLAIIPFFLVKDLKMNSRTKISVALILAMGSIASIATIIRLPYNQEFNNMTDFLYATSDVAVWSITETGLGIIACCLATLRPLFRDFFSRGLWGGTATKSRAAGAAGGDYNSSRWPEAYSGARGTNNGGVGGGYARANEGGGTTWSHSHGIGTAIGGGRRSVRVDVEDALLVDMKRDFGTETTIAVGSGPGRSSLSREGEEMGDSRGAGRGEGSFEDSMELRDAVRPLSPSASGGCRWAVDRSWLKDRDEREEKMNNGGK